MDIDEEEDASWNVDRTANATVIPKAANARRDGKIVRSCPKNDPEDPDVDVIARVLFSNLPYVGALCDLLSGFINSTKSKDTKAKAGESSTDTTSGSTSIADIIMTFKRSKDPNTPNAGFVDFVSPKSFNAFNFIARLAVLFADASFPDVDSYPPSVIVPAHSLLDPLGLMAKNLAKQHTFFFMFVLPERVTVSSPVMDSSVDRDISNVVDVTAAPPPSEDDHLVAMEERILAERKLKQKREEKAQQSRTSMYSTQPRPINTPSAPSAPTSQPPTSESTAFSAAHNNQINTTLHFDVQVNKALAADIQLLPGVHLDEMGYCLETPTWQDKSHFKNHYTVSLASASFISTIKQWGRGGNGKAVLNIRVTHKLVNEQTPAQVKCIQSFEMHLTGCASQTEHHSVVQEMEIDPTHPQWQHIYECAEYSYEHSEDMPEGTYEFEAGSPIPAAIPACGIPFSKMHTVIKEMKDVILCLQIPRVTAERNPQLVLYAEPPNPSPNNISVNYVCPFYVQVCLPITVEDGYQFIVSDTSQKQAELKTLMPRTQLSHNGALVHEGDMARFQK